MTETSTETSTWQPARPSGSNSSSNGGGGAAGEAKAQARAGAHEAERSSADLLLLPEHLLARVGTPVEGGCRPWLGTLTRDGYGQAQIGRGNRGKVHRVVYVHLYGPLAPGLVVDHLCCSPEWCRGGVTCPHRRCVNPAHLQPKTSRANTLRGNGTSARHAQATHCVKGHSFDDENTAWYADGARRTCKTCRRDRSRASRDRRRGRPPSVPVKDRTHCPQGHEYTPENTKRTRRGGRACRTCAQVRDRARLARRRAA